MTTICDTCNDTHMMNLNNQSVMCTRCPVPCQSCRGHNGTGAFCAAVPCACDCHDPLAKEIQRVIGRPLSEFERAVVPSITALTPAHARIVRLLLEHADLCTAYVAASLGPKQRHDARFPRAYIDQVQVQVDRELARSIDHSAFKLVPVDRVAELGRAPIATDLEVTRAEAFSVQHAIAETVRAQLGSFPGGPGAALIQLLGEVAYEALLADIAGNVTHVLI